nr:hypothetical protein FNV92_32080 [Bradyrhizobium cosmicum]
MPREAFACIGHKRWRAAPATAISASRGWRRNRTVLLRWPPLQRPSKGDGPAAATSSLRAQRSNPESLSGKTLDCFAALAMTEAGTFVEAAAMMPSCSCFARRVKSDSKNQQFRGAALKPLISLLPATVHGVVFAFIILGSSTPPLSPAAAARRR